MHHCWKKAVGILCCCGIMAGLSITSYADNFDQVQLVEAKESAGAEYMELEAEPQENETSGGIIQAKVYDRTAETIASEEAAKEAKAKAEAEAQAAAAAAQAAAQAQAQAETSLRQQVVNYALSFVGGPYRYGGSDPRTGVDCSGFTRYVMQNGAGVSINRSSSSQAGQGTPVSAENIRPGDLVFYASGGSIYHVAMYIGGGKVIHAIDESRGIGVSSMYFATPYCAVDVLG